VQSLAVNERGKVGMKPRQLPWKWLLAGLVVILITGLAFLLPRQIGTSQELRDRVSASLSAWTGGTVTLTEPLIVRYFPPSLRGGFVLSNATKLPGVGTISAPDFKVTLDLPELLMGRVKLDALRLGKPTVTLKEAGSDDAPAQPFAALLTDALIAPPVEAIRIRRGTIKTASGDQLIDKMDIRLNALGSRGALRLLGSFYFNGETAAFSMDSGSISETDEGKTATVTLRVTSNPLIARFSGTVTAADGLEGDGDMEAELPDTRRFLNLLGLALPEGESLKAFTASGSVHWVGSTLTFDDGTFVLDGNEAVGLFSVAAGPRPRVEGTLAFERLVLDPYLGAGTQENRLFDWALLSHLDADLRVSAGEMTAAGLELGRGGFTINAKNGVISGEVGELELCGGDASGRLGLDLSDARAEASLVGTVSDIAAETCLKPFAPEIPLTGVGTLKLDVSTGGSTRAELVRGLTGEVEVTARDGTVPINLAQLATPSGPEADGWSRDASTAFSSLDADCSLSAGHLWCRTFRMQTPRGLVSGSGGMDLAQQTLDWDLLIADPVAPLDASQLVMETPPRITLHGSVSEPLIQRANRPTLGDGSQKIAPESSSAVPH
jgi:AsmA protein